MEKPKCSSSELDAFVHPHMNLVRVRLMEIEPGVSIFDLKIYEGSERGWIPYFAKTLQEHFDSVFSYSVEKGNPPPETQEEKNNKEKLLQRLN